MSFQSSQIAGLFLLMTISSCQCKNSNQMILNVGLGGRAVSLAVESNDDNRVWAIAPTGGLYHSVDGGSRWVRSETFPESGCFDVKVCPTNSQIVIVTCIEDSKAINGGGIWRTDDGGQTWRQPPTTVRTGDRYSAFGISFMPNSNFVFAGTDFGLAVSQDLGASWRYSYPYGFVQSPIYSVVSSTNGQVLIAGPAGVRSVLNINAPVPGDYHWFASVTSFNSSDFFHNVLAVYARGNTNLFFYSILGKGLFYSFGGSLWNEVPDDDLSTQSGAYPPGAGFRQDYVKIVPSASGDQDELDLYFSDHSVTCRKTIKWKREGGGPIDFSAKWQTLIFNHSDPTDIVFSNQGNKPLYASNDGGIEKTTDGGKTWAFCGSAATGYDAFQIYDIKSVLSPDASAKNHIYFGTQDDNLYASSDNGQSWPDTAVQITEGGNIECTPLNSGVFGYVTNIMLANRPAFYHYQPIFTKGAYTPYPFFSYFLPSSSLYYVRDNIFVALGNDTFGTGKVFVSNDGCTSFNTNYQFLSIDNLPIDQPSFVSGDPVNPSIVTPSGTTGLFQINNLFNKLEGDEMVSSVPLPPNCVLGYYGAQYYSYQISFAADPIDTNFIILNDIANKMVWLADNNEYRISGGSSRPGWQARPDLVSLITAGGKYLFTLPPSSSRGNFELNNSQITCIRFDRLNHNHIAIGTMEAGIFVSKDRGVTWKKIKNSENIRNVTGFSFVQNNTLYVATWGAGIWVVSLDNT
jgi:photosystem II stability/assembly factor-like uncharacterized protein